MAKNFIFWLNEYSVGVKEIDAQHKALVEMINELYSAFMNKKLESKIEEIINKMAQYTVVHFNTEEKYFKQFNYDRTEEHIAEHKEFVKKVSEFQTKLKEKKVTLTFEVINFLQNWLVNHIVASDKKYTKFFNDNGLS